MKDERSVIVKMIGFCDAIESDVARMGPDIEDFLGNESFQRSCCFSLIQLGEYVKRLSSETRNRFAYVDWTGIAALRNIIAHDYDVIDPVEIWNTVTKEVPELRGNLVRIKDEMGPQGETTQSS